MREPILTPWIKPIPITSTPEPGRSLRPDELHIHWTSIDRPPEVDRADPALPADEAAAFSSSPAKQRSRAHTRRVLARYLDCAPQAVPIVTLSGGKPALQMETPFEFNVSHSGACWAIAISLKPVGLDVEAAARPVGNVLALAGRFFHPHEYEAIRVQPASDAVNRFLRLWTAKEAWVKAKGVGMAHHMARLDGSAWDGQSPMQISESGQPDRILAAVPLTPDLLASVVTAAPLTAIRISSRLA